MKGNQTTNFIKVRRYLTKGKSFTLCVPDSFLFHSLTKFLHLQIRFHGESFFLSELTFFSDSFKQKGPRETCKTFVVTFQLGGGPRPYLSVTKGVTRSDTESETIFLYILSHRDKFVSLSSEATVMDFPSLQNVKKVLRVLACVLK